MKEGKKGVRNKRRKQEDITKKRREIINEEYEDGIHNREGETREAIQEKDGRKGGRRERTRLRQKKEEAR